MNLFAILANTKNMIKKSGFTLIEIIVATFIFALVILGLLSVFSGGNKLVMHTRDRVASAEIGKLFVESLLKGVRQDTWDKGASENALAVGVTYCDSNGSHANAQNINCPSQNQRTVNNREFSAKYIAIQGGLNQGEDPALAGTDLRLLTTTVTWNEPSS